MSDLRDFTGKNRRFTGTDSIKIPSGTTAQRVDGTGKLLLGKVLHKNNAADYANGMHQITVGSSRALREYLSEKEFRTALLKYGKPKKGIIIPNASILVDTVGSFVWVERDGRVAKREIEMDVSVLNNAILVKKGLSVGDHLVTAGGELLNSGDKVKDVSERSEVEND